MLIIRLWNYFRGYVIIKIEGLMLEKFINNSINNSIFLWDIEREDYTALTAKVGRKGFDKILSTNSSSNCRISVIKEKGFHIFLKKLRKRKMMLIGCAIFFCLIFYATSFVWVIEVVGEDAKINDKVIAYLESIDLKPGVKKDLVDAKEIQKQLIIKLDEISYIRVQFTGVKLVLEVKKRDYKNQQNIIGDVPCNIIAEKKAIVQKVVAKNGKAVVSNGDIVKKGQVLITGKIEDERLEQPLLVHANGYIMGKTDYTSIIKEPIYKNIKEETSKTYTVKEIIFKDKRISFSSGDIPFECYIKKTTKNKIIDNWLIKLPVEIASHKYCEVVNKRVKQDVVSLKEMMRIKAIKQIMSEVPEDSKVLTQDVSYKVDEKNVVAIIHIEILEKIGKKEVIK